MAFVIPWNEAKPADPDLLADGAGDIRNNLYAVRERLAVDHEFQATETSPNIGAHNQATLLAQGSDPVTNTGAGFVYTKVPSGTELYYKDAAGNVIQLTSGGKILGDGVTFASQAQGNILYFNGTAWVVLAPGTAGQLLQTQGASANPRWIVPSGMVVQMVNVSSRTPASGTYTVADDNNKMVITDGTELFNLAITPKATSNLLRIDVVPSVSGTSGIRMYGGIFDTSIDATNALAVVKTISNTGGDPQAMPLTYWVSAPNTSAHTFRFRVGSNSGTFYINSAQDGYNKGGYLTSSMTITEIAQ